MGRTTAWSLKGWRISPRVGVLLPADGTPGWADAAFWCALLEAWGIPADVVRFPGAEIEGFTTLVAPAAALTPAAAADLAAVHRNGTSLLLSGQPDVSAAGFLGLRHREGGTVERLRLDDDEFLEAAAVGLPSPDGDSAVALDTHAAGFDLPGGWRAAATWLARGGVEGPTAIGVRRPAGLEAAMVWFGVPADALDWRSSEAVVAAAELALREAAPEGFLALWRWPHGRAAALVVDGDVDHPTGVDPECSRYVAPALETARRAGFEAYGVFAAAANVDHEPGSFPPAPGYYNHSYGHPYSHWDPRPWEALDELEMEGELRRSTETFVRVLGRGDEGIFRLPHFQYEAGERTFAALDRLGFRAESSVGANHSLTAGLPYHQAIEPWSERPADAAHARWHPTRRRRFLQLPISTDPTAPDFPNGCCSYNTLGESVRDRTADPRAYAAVLDDVVERALARRGLAHVFIDPPDAGYGRLEGDQVDYASVVERWMAWCVARKDLAIMTTAELATWWSGRERAVARLRWSLDEEALTVELEAAPEGVTLAVLQPRRAGGGSRGWDLIEGASDG